MSKIRNLTLMLIAIIAFTGCQKEYTGGNSELNDQWEGNEIVKYDCESAFAKGGYVFTTDKKSNPEKLPSLKLTNNKWGWAINLQEEGTTYYKIYAGAGKNDVTKGEIVAYLRVIKTGCEVKIMYAIINGYTLSEAHIYAKDHKPCKLAPGKFGNTFNFEKFTNIFETTVQVCDTNNDGIWIIAHGVICKYTDL